MPFSLRIFPASTAALALAIQPLPALADTMSPEAVAAADDHIGGGIDRLVDDLDTGAIFVQGGKAVLYRKGPVGGRSILFADAGAGTTRVLIDDATLVSKLRAAGAVRATDRLELVDFDPATGVLTIAIGPRQWLVGLQDNKVRQRPAVGATRGQISPDGKWEALVENYNIIAIERATGRRIALTSDGNYDRRYGINYPRFGDMVEANSETPPTPTLTRWSADSTRILTFRLDRNDSPIHTGVQMKPPGGGLPRTFRYVYPNAGSPSVPDLRPMLIDVRSGAATLLDVPAMPLLTPANPVLQWQGNRIHYLWKKRGFGEITLFEIDPLANAARPIAREALKPGVYDSATIIRYAPSLGGTLVVSERSGWAQLYLVRHGDDADRGQALTSGTWEISSIEHISPGGPILVTGNGREKGVNPYYMMLYRVGLDGKTVNLTPEPMHHEVTLSPDGKHFIDRMSTPTTPPRTVLRRASDGVIVVELARADPAKLANAGYVDAEVFQTSTQDGKTPLYATIYRPRNFDPEKSYPVIEHVYAGPSQRRFREDYRNNISGIAPSLAQLGFIVVTIDAPGTARRGRDFRLPAYGKLWTVGVDEHVHVLKQIKARYEYLDLDRVGIAGHSSGGFDAFRFLIQRPDIYKAGVSSAGNHDMRLCKVWWPEMNMGVADEETWVRNTSKTYAGKLRSKLLLVHGDIDDNVPIATTRQLSEALTAAGKPHEFRIINNRGHGLAGPEFHKMVRDFFVRELRP
jgi:dipeptidyl aminopeptidase/acylaminoacyl peptidase